MSGIYGVQSLQERINYVNFLAVIKQGAEPLRWPDVYIEQRKGK